MSARARECPSIRSLSRCLELVFFHSPALVTSRLALTVTYGGLASGRRYTQSDPIGLAGGINTYAYVGGNPISNADPSGLVTITVGGTVRLPGFLKYIFPGYIGQGFSAGIAIQLTKGGSFCPDVGGYATGQGGGFDYGVGKGSLNLGLQRGGISDMAGVGGDVSAHYGLWGGTVNIDKNNIPTGIQANFGWGYNIGVAGSMTGTWSVRDGLVSPRP